MEEVTGDANVQTQKVTGTNQVIIKTVTLELSEREALNAALAEGFGVDEAQITAENISSTVSSEMRKDAIIAVILATICMLLYIWFRFKARWRPSFMTCWSYLHSTALQGYLSGTHLSHVC